MYYVALWYGKFGSSPPPPSLAQDNSTLLPDWHLIMDTDQDSRKRKLAALKERRAQSNLANTALMKDEDARR